MEGPGCVQNEKLISPCHTSFVLSSHPSLKRKIGSTEPHSTLSSCSFSRGPTSSEPKCFLPSRQWRKRHGQKIFGAVDRGFCQGAGALVLSKVLGIWACRSSSSQQIPMRASLYFVPTAIVFPKSSRAAPSWHPWNQPPPPAAPSMHPPLHAFLFSTSCTCQEEDFSKSGRKMHAPNFPCLNKPAICKHSEVLCRTKWKRQEKRLSLSIPNSALVYASRGAVVRRGSFEQTDLKLKHNTETKEAEFWWWCSSFIVQAWSQGLRPLHHECLCRCREPSCLMVQCHCCSTHPCSYHCNVHVDDPQTTTGYAKGCGL